MSFDFRDGGSGQVRYEVRLNGGEFISREDLECCPSGDGRFAFSIERDGGLTGGTFEVIIFIGDREVRRGSFRVLGPVTADLDADLTDTPDPVQVGGSLTYTATARNRGPSTATVSRLIFKVDPSLEFVSATAGCAFQTAASAGKPLSRAVCPVGSLANGSTTTAAIVLRPTVTGRFAAVVRAKLSTTDQVDTNLDNNRSDRMTDVTPAP